MSKSIIIFIIVLSICGCASTRTLEAARSRIDDLKQSNEAGAARNLELATLLESEKSGNQELERIILSQQSELNRYIESEKNRIEAERKLIDSVSGIFSEGSDIVERLIWGYNEIKKYFESLEILE